MMELGLEGAARIGVKPRTYRAPYWDFSENTLGLLERYGFRNRQQPPRQRFSSLLDSAGRGARRARQRIRPAGPHPGDSRTLVPDRFLAGRVQPRLPGGDARPAHDLLDRWKAIFDYAVANEEGARYAFVVHPQSIGRAHMITRLEELFVHMQERGAWFATLSEIADATEPRSSARPAGTLGAEP